MLLMDCNPIMSTINTFFFLLNLILINLFTFLLKIILNILLFTNIFNNGSKYCLLQCNNTKQIMRTKQEHDQTKNCGPKKVALPQNINQHKTRKWWNQWQKSTLSVLTSKYKWVQNENMIKQLIILNEYETRTLCYLNWLLFLFFTVQEQLVVIFNIRARIESLILDIFSKTIIIFITIYKNW